MDQEQGDKKNLLIITQHENRDTVDIVNEVVKMLIQANLFQIYSEEPSIIPNSLNVYQSSKGEIMPSLKIHYIICIGENDTMLRSLRVNKEGRNIPILSISNGNEPIMTSFSYCHLEQVIQNFIKVVASNEVKLDKIMKMQVFTGSESRRFLVNFTSEFQILRDMESSVLKLQVYLRIEGSGFFKLANLWGDGLIISTPFGSMGHSMRHNGPVLHKNIECIQIIPVCPLSLKFRPIILPKDSEILVQICGDSRSVGEMFADGEMIGDLKQDEMIKICKDSCNTLIVKNLMPFTEEVSWIYKLEEVLSWGQNYQPGNGFIPTPLHQGQENSQEQTLKVEQPLKVEQEQKVDQEQEK